MHTYMCGLGHIYKMYFLLCFSFKSLKATALRGKMNFLDRRSNNSKVFKPRIDNSHLFIF